MREASNLITSQRLCECLPACKEFPLFSLLPKEIRLLIWEATWPEPQVVEIVEVSLCSTDDLEYVRAAKSKEEKKIGNNGVKVEGRGVVQGRDADSEKMAGAVAPPSTDHSYLLRPRGSVQSFLHTDYNAAIVAEHDGLGPVALRVCYESRAHTMQYFAMLRHESYYSNNSKLGSRPFFFNPFRDVLWLSTLVTNEFPDIAGLLCDGYGGQQLGMVQNVIVEELVMDMSASGDVDDEDGTDTVRKDEESAKEEAQYPLGYFSAVLSVFQGIRRMQVLLEPFQYAQSPVDLVEPDKYIEHAEAIRARDGEILARRRLAWNVQYVDHERKVYAEFES